MALHGQQGPQGPQGMALLQRLLRMRQMGASGDRLQIRGGVPGQQPNRPQIRGGIPGQRGGIGAMLQQMMAAQGQRQPGNAGPGNLQQMFGMLMGGLGGRQGAPQQPAAPPGNANPNMRSQLRRQMMLRGNRRRAILGV